MLSPLCCRWHALLFSLWAVLAGPVWARECIGVVPAGAFGFWEQVAAGAQQAGAETGIDIYLRGPTREGSVAAQLQMIDKVVARGCKALVIAPSGLEIIAKVSELKARGIPTFYIDRDVGGADVLGVVATNNYRAGQLAAQHLGRLLGGRGRVGMIRMTPPVTSTSERQRGFVQAARAAGLTIAFDRPLGADPEATFIALGERLADLDGLFTPNGSTSRATLAALVRLEAADRLPHVGFDSGQVLLDALKAGQFEALMVQQPFAMGYQSVRLAERAVRKQQLEPRRRQIELDAVLVTRENLEQPAIKALLRMPAPP
ncbi:substrate-binding domain-containing protein [Pseudomonas sp. CrR25]|nr:substrate-binding domain-containing protein [Pseudomonas sp. CrR25]